MSGGRVRRALRFLGDITGVSIGAVGCVSIAWGVFEIYRPAGIIVAGLELVGVGWLLDKLFGGE